METTVSFPNLSIANNDPNHGVIIFEQLNGNISDPAKIINNPTTVAAENYEGKIPIKCGDGTTYKILTTKHPQR